MQFTKAVVTGASSGIGERLAHLLADAGISLILVGRNQERLNAVVEALSSKVSVSALSLDLATNEGRAKLIDVIHNEVPDLVVNNAGVGLYGEVYTHDISAELEVLHINTTAVCELTIEAVRTLLTANKRGVIMNISSAAALQAFPCFATYSAAKAFVKQFSESVDYETRDKGVRVLAALPGVVTTRFQKRAAGHTDHTQVRYNEMPVDFAAHAIWKQIQSEQPIHVFDWKYRVMGFFAQHVVPSWLSVWFIRTFFTGQLPPRDLIKAPQPSKGGK